MNLKFSGFSGFSGNHKIQKFRNFKDLQNEGLESGGANEAPLVLTKIFWFFFLDTPLIAKNSENSENFRKPRNINIKL